MDSVENRQALIQQVWPGWKVQQMLGTDSYGSVYLAEREDMLGKVQATIKVISIPYNSSTVDILRQEGMDDASIRAYLENQVRELGAEIRLMETVKDCSNIVSINDDQVIALPEIFQWYLLIRMELLKPLYKHMLEQQLSVKEVIQLGCDICSALIVCHRQNIAHLDIKPEHIFISPNDDYKLGGFGVNWASNGKTLRMGAYPYMTPECFAGKGFQADLEHAAKADIYALGILMYMLLNNGRIPFLPAIGAYNQGDRDKALMERMHGSPLHPPFKGAPEINRIVFKACAFQPKDRYDSAEEMRQALIALSDGADPFEKPGRTGWLSGLLSRKRRSMRLR